MRKPGTPWHASHTVFRGQVICETFNGLFIVYSLSQHPLYGGATFGTLERARERIAAAGWKETARRA